jgi:hypothetical protein
MLDGLVGLSGDDDEIILTQALSLILQRLIPEEESTTGSLVEIKTRFKHTKRLSAELRQWQDVMFEAGVP